MEEQLTDVNVDLDTAVEEATSQDNFDALDFFSNASLPEGTVTLYRDTAAALRLNEINLEAEQRKLLEDEEGIGITDEVGYTDEDEVAELKQRLNDSAVTFKLRALAPAARVALEKSSRAKNPFKEGDENPEYWEAFNANLIAKSILSVSNAKGQKDQNVWDAARVLKFSEITEQSEWQKLFAKTYELNFVADAIDRAVSADF